jgi:hypothetical protein
MTLTFALLADAQLPHYFEDSTLSLYLGDASAPIFHLGTVRELEPKAPLGDGGPQALHVVLDGRLVGRDGWWGPGNHLGGSEGAMLVADGPTRVWTLDMGAPAWISPASRPLRKALTRALIASDAAELAATPPADLPDPATLCDHDHPEIRRRAVRLRRATPSSTAEAIFLFVQAMPYRFGTWQERASDTLARGSGMCTTKANLQVALMRAAGLEAGFVEMPMEMDVLGLLMPLGWQPMMRQTVKHYFGAVKLGGRWHAADSSYTDDAMRVYAQGIPNALSVIPAWLGEGRPFSPCFIHTGRDMFEIDVREEINEVMGKTSRFHPRHFEALNTRLDRAQGSHRKWLRMEAPAADLHGDLHDDLHGGEAQA